MRVLIAEDEEYLREYLEFLISQEVEADIFSVGSGREAIKAMQQESFDVVVCDYNMPDGNGGEVFKAIRRGELPVRFVLCSSEAPEFYEDLDPAQVYGYVIKPDVAQPLVEILSELEAELQRSRLGRTVDEKNFIRIPASVVRSVIVSPINVYQKLSPSNFLKIIDNQDPATSAELRDYIDRGVTHFYIEKKHSQELLRNYHKFVESEFCRRQFSLEESIDYMQAASEIVRELAGQLGWSEELKEMANRNVNIVVKQIQDREGLAAHIRRFHPKNASYFGAHSALLAYVTMGLVHILKWDTFDMNYKMAFAAFLHDITLTDNEVLNRKDYMHEIAKGRNLPWLEGMRQHPLRAARLLEDWPHVPPGADTIVLQHHERPDGKGFPLGITHEKIRPLSALFIIAEDLVDYCLDQQEAQLAIDLHGFLASRKNQYRHGYFLEIYEALHEMVARDSMTVLSS